MRVGWRIAPTAHHCRSRRWTFGQRLVFNHAGNAVTEWAPLGCWAMR